jgi:signal transduction histidine kinase
MQNFKIAHQFQILFATLILGAAALSVTLALTTRHIDERLKSVSDQTLLVTRQLNDIRDTAMQIIGAFDHSDMHGKTLPAPSAAHAQTISDILLKLKTHLNGYSHSVDAYFPEEASLRDQIFDRATILLRLAERLKSTQTMPEPTTADPFEEFIQAQINLQISVSNAMDYEQSELNERIERIKDALYQTNMAIWLSFLGLFALFGMAALYVARQIVQRIETLRAATLSVQGANLSARVDDDRRDELGDLARSFNAMTAQLAEMIAGRDAAEERLLELNSHLESLVNSRTQEFKHAKDQAEEANRAKTRFLASMGHELRTPLNAIMGFAQMIKLCELSPEKEDEYITIIVDNCRTLLGEINQLLVLSKLSDTDKMIERQPVSLAEALNGCIARSTLLAREYGVKIINETNRASLPSVLAQEMTLNTIFDNLMSNAIKYNRPEHGLVTVRDQSLSPSLHRVYIEDTGMGFKEAFPGQALEPFERLKHFGGAIDGCGVGLTIASNFLNSINGKLGYEPIIEGGMRFWVDLDVATDET